MEAIGGRATSSSPIQPALRHFLRQGSFDNTTAASSSNASSSASSSPPLRPQVLAAFQHALRTSSASPNHIAQAREQLLPLLIPSSRDAGIYSLAALWNEAFESKASEPSGYSQSEEVQLKVQLALTSARLLRNIVGGDGPAQQLVFDTVSGQVLNTLRLGSSLAFSADPELQPLVRSLVQMLSNVVTNNKPLQKALFHKLRLTKKVLAAAQTEAAEQQYQESSAEKVTVLQNLLASPDPGTVEAVQVLLLNCIKQSATNSTGLATSSGGRKLLGQLLLLFEASIEEDTEEDEDGEADDSSHGFGMNGTEADDDFGVGDLDVSDGTTASTPVAANSNHQTSAKAPAPTRAAAAALQVTVGYAIFAHLFEMGLFRHIYRNLAPQLISGDAQDEAASLTPATTEQTLLLKTVDAWINAGGQTHAMGENSSIDQFGILVTELLRLSEFIRGVIAATNDSTPPDRRLVGAHQAIVLVLENLIQLGMIGCEGMETDEQFKAESEEILRRLRQPQVVSDIIELLAAVTTFAPAVSPFVSQATAAQNAAMPQGHVPSSTGLSSSTSQQQQKRPRLDHLNRALVQLLGVLVFQHSPSSLPQSFRERSLDETNDESKQVRAVQDQVREQGGLLLVLGLTRLDESNPYIREHAVFTLRYLLQGNHSSQDLIAQLQPV